MGKVPERSRGPGPRYEGTSTGSGPLRWGGRRRGAGGGGGEEPSRDPEGSEKSRGRGRGVSPAAERRLREARSLASAKRPKHQCSEAQAGGSRARGPGCPGLMPHALSWRYLRRD